MENTKLTRSSSVIDRILKILQGFACAGVIIAAIFIPLIAFLGEKIIARADRLALGALELRLAGGAANYLDIPNIKVSLIVTMIGVILISAASWYCLKVLRELLSPMKAGTPFAAGISGKVRKLAWTVLIGGGVAELGRVLAEIFEARAYQLDRLLNPEAVASFTYNINLNLWFVIAALLLFFLSYIFRSGEALQQQADETL